MYLAGVDYSSSFRNMPYQLYTEWADTRTNGDALGISYNHSTYKDGYYQHGFPLGHAMGGDGDGYAIGIGHAVHAMKRNVNMTYVVMDNQLYALTKGQMSPKSDEGLVTTTTLDGVMEQPLSAMKIASYCQQSA